MKNIIKIGLSVLILLVSTLLFGIFLPNLVLRNNIINKTSTYAEKYQPCLQRLVSNKGQLVPKGVNIIPYTGIIIDSINEIDSKANQPFEVNLDISVCLESLQIHLDMLTAQKMITCFKL